ncbi:retrovirus-related Pol polyprotein from type-1 retrotransposable element R2, partial [Elysia marginata]
MEQYNLAAKEVKVSIKKDKESFTKTLAEKAEKAATAGLIQILYQTTKTLVGRYTRSEMPVKDAVWTSGKYPIDWKEGHLVTIPKKGDLSRCENYRRITLLSIPGKVFNRVLLNRIKAATDPNLRDEQAGFRSNRSTTDQIATLRIIVEQSLEWSSPLIVNFLDSEKAFDSIDRELLSKIMRNYGIPEKIVSLVRKMYDGTCCRIVHDGQLTDRFNIRTGVRQGCLLSPFLFILAIDWLIGETTTGVKNGMQWTLWTQLEDLDFADDLALLSHSQTQMQAKTTALSKLSESIGLRIHPAKSKVFINKCLRRILRIKWTYKISNESLLERTRQIPTGDEIGRRRWRWIGHTLRKPCGSITKNVLGWNPQGKRSRGRPRGTWRRVRDNDVKDSGHAWNHVKRMSQDRERWRGFVDGLYPAPG